MNINFVLLLIFVAAIFCDSDSTGLDPKVFVSNAYKRSGFSDLPLDPINTEKISATKLIDSFLPSLGDERDLDPVAQLDVSELDEKKSLIRLWEEGIKQLLLSYDEGLGELWDENERYRFENEHFLRLRRAELKQLYLQLEKAKERLEQFRKEKEQDIQGVRSRIKRYYDEIDGHLELSYSSYNDSFVADRKNLISRLVQKESALKTDFQNENYSEMERLQKQVNFFGERIEEIYKQSREMSFDFIVKRKRYIAENNAKINYRMALALSGEEHRQELVELRAWLSDLRALKREVEELEKKTQISADAEKWEIEEQARFEEDYYRHQRARDQQELELKRRMREQILKNRSVSKVVPSSLSNNEVSNVAGFGDGKLAEKVADSSSVKDDTDTAKNRYIYILPIDQNNWANIAQLAPGQAVANYQNTASQAIPYSAGQQSALWPAQVSSSPVPHSAVVNQPSIKPQDLSQQNVSALPKVDGTWQRGGVQITDAEAIGEYEEHSNLTSLPSRETAKERTLDVVGSGQKQALEKMKTTNNGTVPTSGERASDNAKGSFLEDKKKTVGIRPDVSAEELLRKEFFDYLSDADNALMP